MRNKCTDCNNSSTYIDVKGYIYCDLHGKHRQSYCRARKLKPSEVKRILDGLPLLKY